MMKSSQKERSLELQSKFLFDRILALFTTVLLLPLFGLIWLGIKLHSPGPALHTQERCGLNGRRYTMYKFRTMPLDAEARLEELQEFNEADGPVFKMEQDPRVTSSFQKNLRKTGLDELPQLWNVLLGDMSIVGPRPPLPEEVARYERWHLRRLAAKPGLTCTWQIQPQRNKIGFDRWAAMDISYIENHSLLLDLKIIVQTIPAVLFGYGQ